MMLRHSTKMLISQKTLHIRRLSNQVKLKVDNISDDVESKLEKVKINDNIQNRVRNLSKTAMSRYNEIVGFTEIDQAYAKVTVIQETLERIQNERTDFQLQITNVRSDLTNIQSEIHEHRRGESKYLELMKKEFEVILKKNKLEEHYAILDKKERELFSHLQAKINMLHEKSRSHTRQWGIISTITGALLGIIGASISAYYRNNDIRKIQRSIQTQFQEQIEQITKDTQQIMQGYENLMEYLQRYEMTLKPTEGTIVEQPKNTESWATFIKRKTVAVWRWSTFQKHSS